MSVTRLELGDLVARIWPLTYIVNAQPDGDGWALKLSTNDLGRGEIHTYHSVDGNGHPTCHADCKGREAAINAPSPVDGATTSTPSVRSTTKKRASYREGVAWIALNDNPGDDDPRKDTTDVDAETTRANIAGYVSTLLLADLFGADPAHVARDIYRVRARHFGVSST